MTLILIGIFLIGAGCSQSVKGFLDRDKNLVRVLVTHSKTGQPVINEDIKIYCPNSIRCIQAPCPTNELEWNGKTDQKGHLTLPERGSRPDCVMTTIAGNDRLESTRLP